MTHASKLTRRTLLQTTALGGASLAFGRLLPACGGHGGHTPAPTYDRALQLPRRLEGRMLTATPAMAELSPASMVPVFAFGGSYPGPTIRVRKGDMFEVDLQNTLGEETNVHWHGLITPADMDGHPKDAVATGAMRTYRFPIVQRAGTYWYHPHAHGTTAKQVYLGMAGFFIVEDDEEAALGLPSGELDVPIVIQDRRFASGLLEYKLGEGDVANGYLGDTVFVNGLPSPHHEVSASLHRLRLLNGCNARVLKVGFADGRTFHLIGTDGGLIDAPVAVTELYLGPAERIDVLVDFSKDTTGTSVELKSRMFDAGTGGGHAGHGSTTTAGLPQGTELGLMRFDIVRAGSGSAAIPGSLVPIERLDRSQAARTRTFELTAREGVTTGLHAINGKIFEMHRVDEQVAFGDLELWEIKSSDSSSIHPMHVHGAQFQVVSRTGAATPTDRGWKDTVLVFPMETIEILVRFAEYRGVYLFHCHTLEHEDDGMMINFEVT